MKKAAKYYFLKKMVDIEKKSSDENSDIESNKNLTFFL